MKDIANWRNNFYKINIADSQFYFMMYDYSGFKLKLNHLRSLKNIQVLLESFEM